MVKSLFNLKPKLIKKIEFYKNFNENQIISKYVVVNDLNIKIILITISKKTNNKRNGKI